jgi:hypothetical protein
MAAMESLSSCGPQEKAQSPPPTAHAPKPTGVSHISDATSRGCSVQPKRQSAGRSGGAPANNPLLERVKFLAITASNLDEFVEIRVASLLQHIEDAFNDPQRPDEAA